MRPQTPEERIYARATAAGRQHVILLDIARERIQQELKHGDQSHLPNGTGPGLLLPFGDLPVGPDWGAWAADIAEWAKARTKAASENEGGDGSITFEHILTEEWAEAIAEEDPEKLRAELVQVAAVAVQWIESLDRKRT